MDENEKCSLCRNLSLKSNFHKNVESKKWLTPHCKGCQKT